MTYSTTDPMDFVKLNGTKELLAHINYSEDPICPWDKEQWSQYKPIICEWLENFQNTLEKRMKS